MADVDLSRIVMWCGASVVLCVLLHALFKLLYSDTSRQMPAAAPKPAPASQTTSRNSTKPKSAQDAKEDAEEENGEECQDGTGFGGGGGEGKPTKVKKRPLWKGKSEYSHPWLLKSLKGHPGTVLDVDLSSNGKYAASACEDGSVIIWDVRNLAARETRNLRVNIELDVANLVAWSPDSKAFVVHKVRDPCIKVYKLDKRKDGSIAAAKPGLDFQQVHQDPVVGFDIASTGKYMITCSSKTDLVIWDLRGEQLDKLDTYLISNYTAKISPCGRFIVATGFSPDVKVQEVIFSKSGEYKCTQKAFELTGHTSGVWDVAFDADTSHVATISKDGTWKLYYTRIDYARGECPYVVSSGRYTPATAPPRLALSPNAEVLLAATDSSLEFFDTATGDRYHTIENVFTGPISCIIFDSSGKYVYCSGDRTIRIFHNACGYYTAANTCQRLMKSKQTSATMERLQATMEESREMLAKFAK